LYSPWPFANAWPDEYWLDGPFTTNDGAFKGRMDTPLVGTADSLAIVSVQLADDGVWTLEVTLDFAAGPRRARKRLDGDPAGRWEVWPKPPDR
jgi:cholesterol oxidase